jgi:pyruvate kinase
MRQPRPLPRRSLFRFDGALQVPWPPAGAYTRGRLGCYRSDPVPEPNAPRSDSAPRLVVTLGPSTTGRVAELREAGATEFRLNAAHMSAAAASALVRQVGCEAPGARCVVDLQGAKMRLGDFEPRGVEAGQAVRFVLTPTSRAIPVPHPELFQAIQPGEELSLADGRMRLQVCQVSPADMTARASTAGVLEPRKGINRATHPVELGDFGAHDLAVIDACAWAAQVEFAISFVRDGSEAVWLRSRQPARRVILKVERREALWAIEHLACRGDELWVCRGDMGAQLGLGPMARAVHEIDPRLLAVPVLMAGQVFEHLKQHPEPTRSEVCHLFDLLARGYAGVVLSDETAIGADPVRATRTVATLLEEFGFARHTTDGATDRARLSGR